MILHHINKVLINALMINNNDTDNGINVENVPY